jgi:hypothetical protein
MIRMSMRDDDRGRLQRFYPTEPISAAIDKDMAFAVLTRSALWR